MSVAELVIQFLLVMEITALTVRIPRGLLQRQQLEQGLPHPVVQLLLLRPGSNQYMTPTAGGDQIFWLLAK